MESNTLGAFIVKRKNILLPNLKYWERYFNNKFWSSTDKNIVHKEILIEATEETVDGYNLYGTEIPVIFSYPSRRESSNPTGSACLGVRTDQMEITKSMKESFPNGVFHYKGKYITDEEVIAWLENAENIESMQRIREWVYMYGKELEALEEIREQRMRSISRDIAIKKENQLEQKKISSFRVKRMTARRDELISKYQ